VTELLATYQTQTLSPVRARVRVRVSIIATVRVRVCDRVAGYISNPDTLSSQG
jgi:hypothetical protein